MSNYSSDRKFTDYIHKNLARRYIYPSLGWEEVTLVGECAEFCDMNVGIDYFFKNTKNQIITVQERFRESRYSIYDDFTLRYRREHNTHQDRIKSEFYKIKAQYMVYGIANCKKENWESCTSLLKYAVIDLDMVKRLIKEEKIIIDGEMGGYISTLENGVIRVPVVSNRDMSSSFLPINVRDLREIEPRAIVQAHGYE